MIERSTITHEAAYRRTIDLHPVLRRMMHRGLRVDASALERTTSATLDEMAKLQERLDALARPAFEEVVAPLRADLARAELALAEVSAKRRKVSPKTGKELKGEEFIHPIELRREAGKVVTALKREIAQWEPEMDEESGRSVLLNVSSTPKMLWYFYSRTGVPPYIDKDTKAPTVDDTALQRLARPLASRAGFPEAKIVQEIRGRKKMIGTYLEMKFDEDGRYRCQYKPKGTKTGRLASAETFRKTGGNHQNPPELFRQFVIPDPGGFFWAVDKKGAEWVVVAYLSGDREMMRVCEEGLNPHTHTIHLMTGVDKRLVEAENKLVGASRDQEYIERCRESLRKDGWKKDLERLAWIPQSMSFYQCGKWSDHSLNYDEGPDTFSLKSGCSLEEGRRLHHLYRNIAYPGLPAWHLRTQGKLQRDRTLVNCFGRPYRFKGVLGGPTYRLAYSFIPQSTVVDAANMGLVYCHEKLPRMEPLVQKHDEVFGQYRFDDSARFPEDIAALCVAMTPEMCYDGRSFTIGNSVAVGGNWRKAHPDENPYGLKETDDYLKRINELREALPRR